MKGDIQTHAIATIAAPHSDGNHLASNTSKYTQNPKLAKGVNKIKLSIIYGIYFVTIIIVNKSIRHS